MSPTTLSPEARRVLEAARELIRDPQHWTQRMNARNAQGMDASIWDASACQWCLHGAIHKTLSAGHWFEIDNALRSASLAAFGAVSYIVVNDRLGHDAVMRILAIALGEEEIAEVAS